MVHMNGIYQNPGRNESDTNRTWDGMVLAWDMVGKTREIAWYSKDT